MRKMKFVIMLFCLFCLITGCKKDESKKQEDVEVLKQDITISERNEDDTVKEGILEGFNFKEVDEVSNRIKIEMEDGSIILAVLSNEDTPITIANFKKLVNEHFYDGLTFHRVISDFMIQGGDPTGTGTGGSSETIKGEFSSNGIKNGLSHTRGVLSMARSNEPNSASSQFFIMHTDSYAMSLDGNYAAFGKVFAGMDVVDKIASVETDENDKPLQEQKIKTIRFVKIEHSV